MQYIKNYYNFNSEINNNNIQMHNILVPFKEQIDYVFSYKNIALSFNGIKPFTESKFDQIFDSENPIADLRRLAKTVETEFVIKPINESYAILLERANSINEGISEWLQKAKDFVSAATDGGSPVGIVHLALDILGFFEFFGIGFVADMLNAVIYGYQAVNDTEDRSGEYWLFALISAGAAVGLDFILKPLKWALAPFKHLFKFLTKATKGGAEAFTAGKTFAKEAEKIAAKDPSKVGALTKLKEFMGNFFYKIADGMAAAGSPTGMLMKLSAALKNSSNPVAKIILAPMGHMISFAMSFVSKIGNGLKNFLKGYSNEAYTITKLSRKGEVQSLKADIKATDKAAGFKLQADTFLSKATNPTAKITRVGDDIVLDIAGKTEKMTVKDATALLSSKLPNAKGSIAKIIEKNPENILEAISKNTKKQVTKLADDISKASKTTKIVKSRSLLKNIARALLLWFKYSKYILGKKNPELTENEYGNSLSVISAKDNFRNLIDDKVKEIGKGATEVRFDSKNPADAKAVTDMINGYAEEFGLPKVEEFVFANMDKEAKTSEIFKNMSPQDKKEAEELKDLVKLEDIEFIQ